MEHKEAHKALSLNIAPKFIASLRQRPAEWLRAWTGRRYLAQTGDFPVSTSHPRRACRSRWPSRPPWNLVPLCLYIMFIIAALTYPFKYKSRLFYFFSCQQGSKRATKRFYPVDLLCTFQNFRITKPYVWLFWFFISWQNWHSIKVLFHQA